MELRNKKTKTAMTLVELTICLTMAGVLMLMLYSVVMKKTETMVTYESGVYYCWKDWNGALFQKTPASSIQAVSGCKVKIPKGAKNVQAYIIGGGAGGYNYNTTEIRKIFEASYLSNTESNSQCIAQEDDSFNMYTKLCYNDGTCESLKYPSVGMTSVCSKEEYYSKGKFIPVSSNLKNILDAKFSKKLASAGYCYLPIYKENILEYAHLNDYKSNGLNYYKGSSNNGSCKGSIDDVCYESSNCYKDGYLVVGGQAVASKLKENISVLKEMEPNLLTCEYIKSQIGLPNIMAKSMPGKVVRASAEAGKEYIIAASRIGNGGVMGASGGKTYFGNASAHGGDYEKGKSINLNTQPPELNALNDIKKSVTTTVCDMSNPDCNGTISDALKNLSANGIYVNGTVEIKTASYEDGRWVNNYNPEKSTDDMVKSGFGLFGASGAAQNCTIEYRPFKQFKYNGYSYSIDNNYVKIISCNPAGNGMGGAIIIKWD